MPKFYILHQPSNNRYDNFVGLNPLSHTSFESLSQAETAIKQILVDYPCMDETSLHICVEK